MYYENELTAEEKILTKVRDFFQEASSSFTDTWPTQYINSERDKLYESHHEDERRFVFEDGPWRYGLAKGGEGGGKSVAGIIKTLERLRRGMSGIMASTDLPHFKRSLWPEFRRWCPWDQVVERHQYRGAFDWEPSQPFALAFKTGAVLYCGGMDDPMGWEGPNVSFAMLDEARRKKKADALKVLDGRVRIPGPMGESPQLWLTTTPRKNWLHEYFGPVKFNCEYCGRVFELPPGERLKTRIVCQHCGSGQVTTEDARFNFKSKSLVITLLTEDNIDNLTPGFVEDRASSLTAAEARVLLWAEWEDIEEGQRFLPSMFMWDACRDEVLSLRAYEPIIIALDAAVSSDLFALVAVSLHPLLESRPDTVVIRFSEAWKAPPGGKIDYQGTELEPGPERRLKWLCENYNVFQVCYDPTQLHDMATRLGNQQIAWFDVFGQQTERLEADRQFLELILQKRIVHDGNKLLRSHIDNADRKLDRDGRRLRIVKREDNLKIDLTVATSMASHRLLKLKNEMGGAWAW